MFIGEFIGGFAYERTRSMKNPNKKHWRVLRSTVQWCKIKKSDFWLLIASIFAFNTERTCLMIGCDWCETLELDSFCCMYCFKVNCFRPEEFDCHHFWYEKGKGGDGVCWLSFEISLEKNDQILSKMYHWCFSVFLSCRSSLRCLLSLWEYLSAPAGKRICWNTQNSTKPHRMLWALIQR